MSISFYYHHFQEGKCVQNCEGSPPCGPRLASAWEELFDDVQTCCKEKLSYLCPESGGDIPCEACTDADISAWATTSTTSTTLAPDTTMFYELDGKCVQNCEGDAPCGGINDESWVAKFDDVQECCKEKLAYLCPESGGDIPCEACTDADISAWTTTTTTGPTTTTAGPNTTLFYELDGKCVQNCEGDAPCGGINDESWVAKFDDVQECCKEKLAYLCPESGGDIPCEACTDADISAWTITTRTPITTTASSITQGLSSFEASEPIFEWYVDWDSGGVCVQNCNGSPPCGGMKNESWVEKFQDVKTCCTTRLYYKCPDPDVPCPACTIADISAWI